MARLSHPTYLMHKEAGDVNYVKLLDITSVPDIDGDPSQVEITTLSDHRRRNMQGIRETSSMTFGSLYNKEKYLQLQAISQADENKTQDNLDIYQIWMGQDGSHGKWEWEGKLVVNINGYGTNEAIPQTVTISDEGYNPIHKANPNSVGNGQIGSIITEND